MKVKRKIIGILICMLMLTTVPLAAGMNIEKETQPEPIEAIPDEETDGIFGITIIRGFVSNVKQKGTDITFRAIRLHYLKISAMEKSTGVLRFEKCRVNDFIFERRYDMGPLGSFSWIFGIVRGDLGC